MTTELQSIAAEISVTAGHECGYCGEIFNEEGCCGCTKMCEYCGEHKATARVDNDQVCQECNLPESEVQP